MSDSWRGRYVDGRTAALREIALATEHPDLVGRAVDGEDELFRWPTATLAFEALDAGTVAIRCPSSTITSPDAAVTTDIAETRKHLGNGVLPQPRRLLGPRWAVAFAVGSAALAAILYGGLTPLARTIAHHVPPRIEAELGQGLSAILATRYCDTEPARRALAHLTTRLGGSADSELHVLDTDAINAFTLPGGAVIVTRGLLEQAIGPDEVAGVLAHELEHVRLRHVMIRVVRSSLMTMLWQATLGDYTGLLVIDPKTALDVTNLRFSRDDERAADRGALDRLAAGHISADGFAQFFDRLRAKTDVVPAWLSSHPASAERLARIRESRAASAGTMSPAVDDADWKSLQAGCARRH